MASYDIAARNIAEVVRDLDGDVRKIAQRSQATYRSNMKAGESLPKFGDYSPADDDAAREIMEADKAAYRDVMDVVDFHVSSIMRSMSDPATAGEVATVSLALSRKNIDKDELQALLDRYGHNYTLASAITERARELKLFLAGEVDKLDRERAGQAAANLIINRHPHAVRQATGFIYSPENVGRMVMESLHHVDAFGQIW